MDEGPKIPIRKTPLPVMITRDADGTIVEVNDWFVKEWGRTPAALLGMCVDDLTGDPVKHKEQRRSFYRMRKYRLMGDPSSLVAIRMEDGTQRPCVIGLSPMEEGLTAAFVIPISMDPPFWRNSRFLLAAATLLVGAVMMLVPNDDLSNLGMILSGTAVGLWVSFLEKLKR